MTVQENSARASPSSLNLLQSVSATVLPERVREIIAAEDRAAEILVGWVQLSLGFLLAALYLISPVPRDAGAMFMPVPIALAAFIAFSLFRLWLIKRRKTPDWFVGISICVDVGMLIGLIWSFHLQYGQPPGFSLKAPTFVYLFVLVVVRALRFDPRYVLTAGLVAAGGWLLLTVLVVASSPSGSITRSFSDYITSSHILVGAEFDKIFALLIATFLLALNARRAHNTLVAAVRESTAVREIQRFLSRGVAEQIAASETLIEAGHAVERQAAIMFLDIRGFTPLAMRLPPRDVVRILTSLHAHIIPIVRAHGGVVDKFLGDGIMITFGAVETSQKPAADALKALSSVLEACRLWERKLADMGLPASLRVNAAVASGTVVFAALGDENRLEYTVIGDAVNLAAKLEKHNKVVHSRALISENTLEEARAQDYAPDLPLQAISGAAVAGVQEPIDLFAVVT
jgi:adenylate cyclase